MTVADAVVVGAGPNGLVAANVLADAGWDVVVLEAQPEPGGAVRTAEVTAPGFRNDLFSAFYPFTAASPVIRDLGLEDHGLRWSHAPHVLVHPRRDGVPAMLDRSLAVTAASLEADARGDGAAYERIIAEWCRVSGPLIGSLLAPFPPVRHALRLARAARPAGLRDLARLALLPLRRFVEEEFRGSAAALLFAGSALHADLTPEAAGSALFGWLLVGLGQEFGFPVPVGGAVGITDALVGRAVGRGVEVRCDSPVERIVVRGGRAVGVAVAGGDTITARRAVLADCDVQRLLLSMVDPEHVPAEHRDRLRRRFQRSSATFKVDWALSAPIPWSEPAARRAGTVHVAESLDELSITSTQLAIGLVPAAPFLLVGQMTTADASRSPRGTESAWTYTHVPVAGGDAGDDGISGRWETADRERFVRRIEQRIELLAPGFADRVIARHVMAPPDLEARDGNLVGGDISGGTAQLHQQAIFRPVSGWGRPETPVRRLYLASASAHPGGAVHGACGANVARAAILHHRLRR